MKDVKEKMYSRIEQKKSIVILKLSFTATA